MILGESPEGQEFRHMIEASLAEDWLESVRPEIGVQYGGALLGMVQSQIESRHADADITASHMGSLLRAQIGDPLDDEEYGQLRHSLDAQAVFRGFKERTGSTGIRAFDSLFDQQDQILGNATDADMYLELAKIVTTVRRIGDTIYLQTTPGSLAC